MNALNNQIDGYHETFAALMRAGDVAGFAGRAQRKTRALSGNDALRHPVLHLPRLSWWQRTRLARLDWPDTVDMLTHMIDADSTRDHLGWRHAGADLGQPEMDAHLAPHINETRRRVVQQIVQSSFAPELWGSLDSYFVVEGTQDTIDEARVLQAYVLFAFVTGTDETARYISEIVPMTPDIEALRDSFMDAHRIHMDQAIEVSALRAALREHGQSPQNSAKPDWTECLTTRA